MLTATWVLAVPIILGILFVLEGINIKYLNHYNFLMNYGKASEEEKNNIDIIGLKNFIGRFCFINAVLLFFAALFLYLEMHKTFIAIIVIFVAAVAFMTFNAQKYDKNKTDLGRRNTFITLILLALIAVGFSVLYDVYGSMTPTVSIKPDMLQVKGVYGVKVPLKDIESIKLVDKIPVIKDKISGFSNGKVLKGDFKIEEYGEARIYLQSSQGPYILITTKNSSYIIINYKSAARTRNVYKNIYSHYKNGHF